MAVLTDAQAGPQSYPHPGVSRQHFRRWLLYVLAFSKLTMSKTVEADACHDSILQELQQFDTSGLIPSSKDVESHARELRQLAGRLEASKGKASLAFTPNTTGFADLAATTFGDMALTCVRFFPNQRLLRRERPAVGSSR